MKVRQTERQGSCGGTWLPSDVPTPSVRGLTPCPAWCNVSEVGGFIGDPTYGTERFVSLRTTTIAQRGHSGPAPRRP
jgi:hypothetical protein